jgi:hypothetical protein
MGTVQIVVRLDDWFAERLEAVNCSPDARAYVVSVLSSFKRADGDLSDRSIVVAFANARDHGNFEHFQRIGDWVLWTATIMPGAIAEHRETIETLGRMSYYTCHRMVQRTWPVYEELADELPSLAQKVRCTLQLP